MLIVVDAGEPVVPLSGNGPGDGEELNAGVVARTIGAPNSKDPTSQFASRVAPRWSVVIAFEISIKLSVPAATQLPLLIAGLPAGNAIVNVGTSGALGPPLLVSDCRFGETF